MFKNRKVSFGDTEEDKNTRKRISEIEIAISTLERTKTPIPHTLAEELSSLKAKLSKNKVNARKIYHEGVEFDSKREMNIYKALKKAGLNFDMQVEVELIPAFKIEGESVRSISIIVDFYVEGEWFVDAKGIILQPFPIKWKLLKNIFRDTRKYAIISKDSEIDSFVALVKRSK